MLDALNERRLQRATDPALFTLFTRQFFSQNGAPIVAARLRPPVRLITPLRLPPCHYRLLSCINGRIYKEIYGPVFPFSVQTPIVERTIGECSARSGSSKSRRNRSTGKMVATMQIVRAAATPALFLRLLFLRAIRHERRRAADVLLRPAYAVYFEIRLSFIISISSACWRDMLLPIRAAAFQPLPGSLRPAR